MSKKSPGLTPAQRHGAAVDMTLYYLNSYWCEWRYVQVLGIKKLLQEKYEFYDSIVKDNLQETDQASIAQEIKHGLHFDAIAHCVQFIEDLFALIRASKDPDYFIRNIITYSAGTVTSPIKVFKTTDQNIRDAFHIPPPSPSFTPEQRAQYDLGIATFRNMIDEFKKFFQGFEFFYIQYKHGLTIPLRTFGNRYNAEQIEKEKNNEMPNYLAVFDNLNLKAAEKTLNTKWGLFFPVFTDNVRMNINALQNENNYLRFVYPPEVPVKIDDLVAIAQKIKVAINIFRRNYYHKLKNPPGDIQFSLPIDPATNTTMDIRYQEIPDQQ